MAEATRIKLRRDPWSHPPLGFRRGGAEPHHPPRSQDHANTLRAFELAAAGRSDQQVADELGVTLCRIRGALRSPLYPGRLADGGPRQFRRRSISPSGSELRPSAGDAPGRVTIRAIASTRGATAALSVATSAIARSRAATVASGLASSVLALLRAVGGVALRRGAHRGHRGAGGDDAGRCPPPGRAPLASRRQLAVAATRARSPGAGANRCPPALPGA